MSAKEWIKDYKEFEQVTRQFYNQEISVKDYKGISGGFGSYAQRGGNASMLRLRLLGGRIDKDKLKFIADSIEKYQIDRVHVTTCQTVQLHDLNADTVCELAVEALEHGIVTRGGGGDYPRNVMVSPLTGVERGEYFDVGPYAAATAEYLMGFIKTVKLPRKLKVGFSNSPANLTHVTFRDLGFAAREDGKFDVYSAGGLGANPKLGIKVAEGVDGSKILYYVKAMIDLFVSYGNYENRAKARTRFLQESLGQKGYVSAFREKLETILTSDQNLDIQVNVCEITKKDNGTRVSGERIIPQKQSGLYAVSYHPIGGSPSHEKFKELYEIIKEMDQVELRLSPDETIYIINCTGNEAEILLAATQDGARNLFESSVACIGASICQIGVRDSQKLMEVLTEASRQWDFADGVLPRIHISGCPSSCGTHQIGAIGFRGGVKMIDKKPLPAFVLFVNGREVQGEECLGEEIGMILESDIPTFLKEMGQAVAGSGMLFDHWLECNENGIREIAQKYLIFS